MKDVLKKLLTVCAVIFGVVVFFACKGGLDNPPSGGPAISAKVLSIKVAANTAVVQQWVESPAVPERGGWFERTDAPTLADTVDYTAIDPKNLIQVTKILDAEQGEAVCEPDEFTVVVLSDTETKAVAANTKLLDIGYAYIKVFLKVNKDVIATYYDAEGRMSNNPYLTMLVASAEAPDKTFAGFTIQKNPVKTVYDWEEPFVPYGLEVLKWYGGLSFEEDGIPVIAGAADYQLDFSEYTNKTRRLDSGLQVLPTPPYDPIPVYVRQSLTERAGEAAFNIDLDVRPHKVVFKSESGEDIVGGSVSFNGGGGPNFTVRSTVTINFNRSSSYNLNADSVRVRYGELNVPPSFSGSSTTNQLNFVWLGGSFTTAGGVSTVNEEQSTVTASFEMPAADVTVVVEYVYASTRLSNIEIKPEGASAWNSIHGFSPNTSIYDYVLPLDADSLDLRVSTNAPEIAFDFDRQVNLGGSTDPKVATINDISVDGVNISIIASNEGGASPRTYIVRVKRFNSNKVAYNFTGNVQTFHPPVAGYYRFTAWGGDGGNLPTWDLNKTVLPGSSGGGEDGKSGHGGKVSGVLYMDPEAADWQPTNTVNPDVTDPTKVAYIYVGEGGWAKMGSVPGRAAWNGGGRGGYGSTVGAGAGGAGATSVSLTRGSWSDWQVLLDRIMVAGGSGGYSTYSASGGAGGGLIAQGGRMVSHENGTLNDFNPTTGYGPTVVVNGFWTGAGQKVGSGRGGQSFGIGGTPPPATKPGSGGANEGRGGGGGGYFGGEITWGKEGNKSNAGGGGGSSYVSGHPGCISYGPQSAATWMVPVGTTDPLAADTSNPDAFKYHYSGRVFLNTDISTLQVSQPKQGPIDSPAVDPYNDTVGTEGTVNRHGILVIEYRTTAP